MSDISGYTFIGPVAYRGKKGCKDVRCSRFNLEDCYGWHCSYCDAPCSQMGHGCDAANTILAESERILREERDS